MIRRHVFRTFLAAVMVCAALPSWAQVQQSAASGSPSEVPARLRHLEGTVTVQRAAAGETEDAIINLPLGSGDRIWSADDGRVEIMFEDGTTLWLDARTTLDFVSLPGTEGTSGPIVRLWTGSVYVERPAPYQGTLLALRLDAPSGAVTFDEAGLFRVDVDDDQTVWLSAYDGTAVLDAGGLSERIRAGERTLAESGSAPARAGAFNTSEADDFSNWRDERMTLLADTRQYVREREYVPRTVSYYAADLEPYGSWSYHPTYAAWYWKPYAAVAWSPYRHGRWVYTYAGWSWVAAAPWGYVTTHYGRWHHTSGGWIWFPGRSWRPAHVHWYVGGGYVGWVPLDYYGRPAVSFGAHLGGVSVNVNIGGHYGYPHYGYGYPYYGYSYYRYPFFGHRPYKRCCNFGLTVGGGHGRFDRLRHGNRFDRFDRFDRSRDISPIGSASGTGRVVKGLGYSSGLADAWTVVEAEQFSTREVGRVAVARNALPRHLSQASKAQLSGPLRAREPATLVPPEARRAQPTTRLATDRPMPNTGASGPVRATTGANAGSTLDDARRRAVPRAEDGAASGKQAPGVSGAVRRPASPSPTVRSGMPGSSAPGATKQTDSNTARARAGVPTTPQTRSAPAGATRRAAPRSPTVAPGGGATSAPGAVRRPTSGAGGGAVIRTPSPAQGQVKARTPSNGAVRRPTAGSSAAPAATRPPTARPSGTAGGAVRRPTAVPSGSSGGAVRRPSAAPSGSSGAVRRPTAVPSGSTGGAVPRPSMRPPSRPGGSDGTGSLPRTARPTVRPSSGARTVSPPVARPSSRPGGGSSTVRSANPRSGSRGNVTPRAVPSGRTAPAVRPAPSGNARPGGAVRAPAVSRPGGVRPTASPRPSGGVRPTASPRPSGGVRPTASPRPSGGVRPPAAGKPGGGGAVRPPAAKKPGGSGTTRPARRPAKPRGGSLS